MKYLKLIRVKQWIKNGFVFVPIFFSGKLLDANYLQLTCLGFIIFSFAASSVYVLNDFVDIKADQNHPEKKKRPLASGAISKTTALAIMGLLILIVAGIITYLGNWSVAVITAVYIIMNIGYSFGLKHIAIIDLLIISFGFVLRVFMGGSITGIPISDWAILLTFSLAMVLAIGKRRGEIMNAQLTGNTRKALDGYNVDFLDMALAVSSIITIVCYVMYTISAEVQERIHHYVFYTFIFIFIGLLRYLQQTLVFNNTESPTKMLYKDLFLQITILLWGVSFILLIYFK